MSFLKKTHSAPAEEDPHAGMDVDQVMKKYDRESNVRIWEGWQKIALRWLMAVFSLYCIGMTLFSTAGQEVRLSAFLGCIVVIVFLYAQFWFAGNMVSLMKRLLPVILVTLIVGNRAL